MQNDTNGIFLDNASTTKPYDDVVSLFSKTCSSQYYNPSSIHKNGVTLSYDISKIKAHILSLLQLDNTYEVIFTSGATEANNLAILGTCFRFFNRGKHIITSSIEHPSVLEVFKYLEKEHGFSVTYLKPDSNGTINIEQFKKSIREDTIFVSLMGVNNETGQINDLENIRKILSFYPKIIFHSDMVQTFGKVEFKYSSLDLFTITAHKIHGLKGIGLLIKKAKISLKPIIYGGGQQNNYRSGTIDYPSIVAFDLTISNALKNMKTSLEKIRPLYDHLLSYLKENSSLYHINSSDIKNPYILNFSLLNKKSSVIVEALSNENIFVSSTSACNSKKEPISYVVFQTTNSSLLASNTIRVSFSEFNTMDDVNTLINKLDKYVKEVR